MDKYEIKMVGVTFVVSKKTYIDFYREKERSKYLRKEQSKYITVSYNALDNDGFNGEETIADSSVDVESVAIRNIMIEKLRSAMEHLTAEELVLIHALFFEGESEVKIALSLKVNQSTISRRKDKILIKLKRLMEI